MTNHMSNTEFSLEEYLPGSMKFLSLETRAHSRERFESCWHLQGLRVSSRVRQYLGVATYGLFEGI